MKKIKAVFHHYVSLEGTLFRYSLSYSLLLALLPTIIIVINVFPYFIENFNQWLDLLYHYIPEDLLKPFVDYVMSQKYPTFSALFFTNLPSLYLASRSFYSFLLVSAMDEEFHTYGILLRIKAVLLFVYFVFGVIVTFVILPLFVWRKVTVFFIGVFILFYFLYRSLSFEKRPVSFGFIGAIFTMSGIWLTGVLFLKVVEVFFSYQTTYGPLASLVILLLSMYVISSIIYFGYCLNLEYGSKYGIKKYKMEWLFALAERMKCMYKKIKSK